MMQPTLLTLGWRCILMVPNGGDLGVYPLIMLIVNPWPT